MLGVGRSMIRVSDPVSNKIVITLDEASAGLDPVVRDEEHSILMSTHITSVIGKIALFLLFTSNLYHVTLPITILERGAEHA